MYKKSKVKDIVELILDGKSNSYITRVLEKTFRNTVIDIRSKLNDLDVPIEVIKHTDSIIDRIMHNRINVESTNENIRNTMVDKPLQN